jgi:hypothetical protein
MTIYCSAVSWEEETEWSTHIAPLLTQRVTCSVEQQAKASEQIGAPPVNIRDSIAGAFAATVDMSRAA